jgi:hypothetical protein
MTETQNPQAAPNGDAKPSAVARVASIPVVQDTLTNVHSVIKKNSYSAAAYDKASIVVSQVYKATEPLQARLHLQIQAVDGLANRGLDFVQGKYPYVFEASSDELIGNATKPANDAAAAARARLAPVVEQFSAQLQSAQNSLHSVQTHVAAAIAALPRSPGETQAAASHAASSLLAEVERIRDNVAAHAKGLPTQLQHLAHNVLEHLQKGANEIRAELSRSDVKAVDKANNVLKITSDHAQPVIQDALATVKGFISDTLASGDKPSGAKSGSKKKGASEKPDKDNGSANPKAG